MLWVTVYTKTTLNAFSVENLHNRADAAKIALEAEHGAACAAVRHAQTEAGAALPQWQPDFPVRLVCWHCGAARDLLTHGPAQFAFEVAGWANDAGMKGFFDMARGRVLLFCNRDHAMGGFACGLNKRPNLRIV